MKNSMKNRSPNFYLKVKTNFVKYGEFNFDSFPEFKYGNDCYKMLTAFDFRNQICLPAVIKTE